MTNTEIIIKWYVTSHFNVSSRKCLILIDPYGKEFCCDTVHDNLYYEYWAYDKITELSHIISFLFPNTVIFKEKK